MNRSGHNPFAFAAEYQYAQSVVTEGELVFTAGQGGFGPDGEVVDPDDIEAQLRQAYANLAAVLEANGASLATVVKMTVYLARAEDYDTFKRVRGELFSAPYPAKHGDRGGRLPVRGHAGRDGRGRPGRRAQKLDVRPLARLGAARRRGAAAAGNPEAARSIDGRQSVSPFHGCHPEAHRGQRQLGQQRLEHGDARRSSVRGP